MIRRTGHQLSEIVLVIFDETQKLERVFPQQNARSLPEGVRNSNVVCINFWRKLKVGLWCRHSSGPHTHLMKHLNEAAFKLPSFRRCWQISTTSKDIHFFIHLAFWVWVGVQLVLVENYFFIHTNSCKPLSCIPIQTNPLFKKKSVKNWLEWLIAPMYLSPPPFFYTELIALYLFTCPLAFICQLEPFSFSICLFVQPITRPCNCLKL